MQIILKPYRGVGAVSKGFGCSSVIKWTNPKARKYKDRAFTLGYSFGFEPQTVDEAIAICKKDTEEKLKECKRLLDTNSWELESSAKRLYEYAKHVDWSSVEYVLRDVKYY